MQTIVTLDIFSGRPNPTWVLSDDHSEELVARSSAAQELTMEKPSGALQGLGYRGFSVSHVAGPAAVQPAFHIHEAIIDRGPGQPNLIQKDRDLEKWLLSTAGNAVPGEARSVVEAAISAPPVATAELLRVIPPKCPHCFAQDAPVYNPAKWNIPSVQPFNNCYNYANDHITNTFAQPGRAHGKPITGLSCPGVEPSAHADGLVNSPNFTHPLGPGHGWYVALVIWPGVDYHWYRQDKVGCWSHKPGSTPARNTDNSGHSISDPKTCNRGPYTVFCDYMITTRRVVIR